MKRLVFWLIAFSFVFGPVSAAVAPHVVLVLKQAQVVRRGDKTALVAVPKAGAKRGSLLRYTIVATNIGSKPAFDLSPLAKIPPNTVFVVGSAAPGTTVEYSLDGHSFSAKPMVKIKTVDGKVKYVPANPDMYVALHWHDVHPLGAHATQLFSYEVRIK